MTGEALGKKRIQTLFEKVYIDQLGRHELSTLSTECSPQMERY